MEIDDPGSTFKRKQKIWLNVVMISLIFFLGPGNFLAIQNIQSSLHTPMIVGVNSLACVYAGLAISVLLVPLVGGKIGNKVTLTAGLVSFIFYSIANIFSIKATLLASSVLIGMTFGPVWAVKDAYLSHLAQHYVLITSDSFAKSRQKFSTIFLYIFLSSSIFWNILSSLVLDGGYLGQNSTNLDVNSCGINACAYINKNTTQQTVNGKSSEPSDDSIHTLFAMVTALSLISAVLALVFIKNFTNDQKTTSYKSSISTCFELAVKNVRMMLLVPFIISQTLVLTVLCSDFNMACVSCTMGVKYVGYTMIPNSIISLLFLFLSDRLAKYTGRIAQVTTLNIIWVVLLLTLYWWKPTSDDFYVFFIISSAWGVCVPICIIQGRDLLSEAFNEKQHAAYANMFVWTCLGFCFAFAMNNWMCLSTTITVSICFVIIGFIFYVGVEIMTKKHKRLALDQSAQQSETEMDEIELPLTS